MLRQCSMDMRKISVLLLALSFVLCAVYMPGQAEGAVLGTSILGTIVSENGTVFSGVQIEAVNATTSRTFTAFSGVDGNYSLPLDPGLYNVIAILPNHTANVSYAGVLVTLGQEVHLNFTMSEVLCTLTGYVTNGTHPVY
ncbi:MAG: carboxypeptidase regulatory-like domain-containing protein, partial [Methanomassiliicoccus sp.]